ncbi:ABC transporter substrate-binding protein [Dongia soli]|uniref:ABC transporter substrate-binding protein n=1 Tax=Dongia soli TaxID=600628 RepID=A0ABU5E9H6_9PROT|nr:ABC transporter substrate-binding protein [Dongia soli]MDY0882848.1 ABC transporter substrate-binding protein [Dongia soli]
MINRRNFVRTALIAGTVAAIAGRLGAHPALAEAGDPKAKVEAFYAVLLDCMKQGPQLGFDGRYKKLEPVIQNTFDVPIMARIAVGQEWTNMPADKKSAILEVFTRYMITTYASRFKAFSGQSFSVGDVKQPNADRKLVESKIIRANGEPVQLNYVFRQGDDGWKIIDIYLSGTISEMARMRSDFSETIRSGGADALIKVLEQKIAELKKGA